MECARFGVYSDAWREQSHTVWSGRGGVGVGGVGLCTGVEIRSCGNKVGGFAAGGRVLGLGERTGGCSAAHCGLLVENAMVGGGIRFLLFLCSLQGPTSCCCNLHACNRGPFGPAFNA